MPRNEVAGELSEAGGAFMQKLLGAENYRRLLEVKSKYEFVCIPQCVEWLLNEVDGKTLYASQYNLDLADPSNRVYSKQFGNINKQASSSSTWKDEDRGLFMDKDFDCPDVGLSNCNISDGNAIGVEEINSTMLTAEQTTVDAIGLSENVKLEYSEEMGPQCEECDETFSTEDDYNAHIMTHSIDKQHTCDVCGNTFENDTDMNEHRLIHDSQRQNFCKVCSRQFTKKSALTRHMRLHSDPARYVCSECGEKFMNKFCLGQHKSKVHAQKRPHICDVCSKAFTTRGNLNQHKLIHDGVKPYVCKLCGQAFVQRQHLKRHTTNHHARSF